MAPTGLMATMDIMEKGVLRLILPLWLTPLLMLMPGTATMAMDTVATDTVDTTALMATMAMERGLLMLSQSPLLLPTPTLLLIPGMAMDTVATDTVDTTGLMATMATDCTERGPQRLRQSPPLLLTPLLMLMPGTAIMATATTATDTDTATTVHTDTATMATERGPQRLRQSPPLLPTLTLWLTPLLMLMPGTATTATVAMVATATATTATDIDTATTAHTDMPTGAKQAKREVDSSSDCDFPSTLASISRACA